MHLLWSMQKYFQVPKLRTLFMTQGSWCALFDVCSPLMGLSTIHLTMNSFQFYQILAIYAVWVKSPKSKKSTKKYIKVQKKTRKVLKRTPKNAKMYTGRFCHTAAGASSGIKQSQILEFKEHIITIKIFIFHCMNILLFYSCK